MNDPVESLNELWGAVSAADSMFLGKHYDTVRAALEAKPEGEKDDLFEARCRGCIEMLISMGFKHKIENGFHIVEGHGTRYKHVGLTNIGNRIAGEFMSRPAQKGSE